ncbi:hypothetical protein [uncultured Tateyamaria sp.]|uniref:hypothetical protein n=1 Tax=uncultured Tateyamaria sp. TaxID=455651 RepID=UPI002638863D|nr:hypothetical protein [uncultured Tateyamaria sp.]
MRLLVILCAVLATPAVAQDGSRFYPPEGCTPELTVQSRGCSVSNIYICSVDQPGENWRIEFDVDGPTFLSKIDSETQWLESYDLFPTYREVLVQPATDPASLTELLETGTDSYDFTQHGDSGPVRVVGYDRLTGEEVVIDGEPLLVTEFSARHETTDGVVLEITGNEYVSVRHRRFISGTYSGTGINGTFENDGTPVDFIYPGEPGFFTKTPLYDCESSLARFVPTLKGYDQ